MITIDCPWCSQELRVEDLSASVRCEECSMVHEIADQAALLAITPIAESLAAA